MIKSGERWCPLDTSPNEALVNIERYVYATHLTKYKRVCDVGCGMGLGTYLYSLTADRVYALDYDQEALDNAKLFPAEPGKVEFIRQDLEKDFILPECDIIVAIEFLEHLVDPLAFLRAQKAKELVFSLPKDSLAISKWHKYDIKTEQDVQNLLVNADYRIERINVQEDLWFYGQAVKI